ncbi:MAG TPA: hypothetical protein VHQ00_07330 [Chloroflexota bacterium]|nr:hypothetical protein [Chloroflexota bacterium]
MITFVAVMVMLFLPIVFAWVPVPGLVGLAAGLIGGYLIGRPGKAFLYALLPFAVLAGLIVAAGFGVGLLAGPLGALAGGLLAAAVGAFAFIVLIVDSIALLLGAAIGGAYRSRRETPLMSEPSTTPRRPGPGLWVNP